MRNFSASYNRPECHPGNSCSCRTIIPARCPCIRYQTIIKMLKTIYPCLGEPPPEITWDFEGKPLSTDDRVKINNIDYRTKFVVKRAMRSDTGTFNITARNDSGILFII